MKIPAKTREERVSRPMLVTAGVLAAVNLYLLLSILGIQVFGKSVLSLSSTVEASTSPATPQPAVNPNMATDELNTMLDSVSQNQPEYEWKTVRMRVTAYCPCRKCCGKFADGRTACNHLIHRGDVFLAADKRYSFGTRFIVPGYNQDMPIQCLDRGKDIKGDRLDIFFHTHSKAREWGVKYLDVQILQRK